VRQPRVVLAYSTAALALSAQWIAAKIGLGAAPALELSTMRFAIASVVLVALALAGCTTSSTRVQVTATPCGPPTPVGGTGTCAPIVITTLSERTALSQ